MDTEGYRTKNINIGAYLYASNLKLLKTTRINGEVFFLFSPKARAEELINQYFAGTANVNPRELFARLNDLRDLIFQGGNSSHG